MEDPITSPKMTLTVFRSFFCELISKFFTNFSLFVLVKMCITRLYLVWAPKTGVLKPLYTSLTKEN